VLVPQKLFVKITSALELPSAMPETLVDPRFMKKLATRLSIARKLALKETNVCAATSMALWPL
jgi:hypothetical protein